MHLQNAADSILFPFTGLNTESRTSIPRNKPEESQISNERICGYFKAKGRERSRIRRRAFCHSLIAVTQQAANSGTSTGDGMNSITHPAWPGHLYF